VSVTRAHHIEWSGVDIAPSTITLAQLRATKEDCSGDPLGMSRNLGRRGLLFLELTADVYGLGPFSADREGTGPAIRGEEPVLHLMG
jgi:hypothetical protein